MRAVLLFLGLALVFVGPALMPGRTLSASDQLWRSPPWAASAPTDVQGPFNFYLNDSVRVLQPFLQFTRAVVPDVPLWNPYLMAGRPFLANAQSAVFSPFSVPAYVLPFWRSLAVIAALKLLVGALGAYLLGRALGMRREGALVAGVVYGFSLWAVCWLSWPQSGVWVLVPWLLLASERLIRDPGRLTMAALATAVAAQFLGGHPGSSRDVLLGTVVFFLARVMSGGRAVGEIARRSGAFAGAVLLGAALAAVVIVPFYDLLLQSADVDERGRNIRDFVPARFLLGLFVPDYWGRPGSTSTNPFFTLFGDRAFYVGAMPLMLVAAALIMRPSRGRLVTAAGGALAMAVVVGTPGLHSLATSLPGQEAARVDRLVPWFVMAAATLAGWGMDDLVDGIASRARRRIAIAARAVLVVLPAAWMAVIGTLSFDRLPEALELAWVFATPSPTFFGHPDHLQVVRLGGLVEWLALAGAGAALLALRLGGRIAGGPFAALALVLVAVDLGKAGIGFNPATPMRHAVQPATGALRYLQARTPGRVAAVGEALPVDTAMRYGILDARGRDFPIDRRYKAFWGARVDSVARIPAAHLVLSRLGERQVRALSMLSVESIVVRPDDERPRVAGLRVAYDGADARVLANTRALPRTFLVDGQRRVRDGDAALAAVSAPAFDARRAAIVEQPVDGVPVADLAGRSGGTARITRYGRERVVLDVRALRPGIVVLTDAFARGWKATVGGRDVPVHRVDYLLRGVAVPAGRHRVELRYAPASWRIGWILSLAGLGVLAALVAPSLVGVVARRRRRARLLRE